MNSVQIRSAERALSVGTWLIVAGAMLYSVLTVTPLMAAHTPPAWVWTAPILPVVVDAAVVIVVRLDSILARLGGHGGRWSVALRWMTGGMTLALNVADSALKKDLVGVAVHAVAPLLLIVTAETSLAYRRAITTAVTELETRRQAETERREQVAREREEARLRQVREEREHAAVMAREQREHEAALARETAERAERERREEREHQAAREVAERVERERREQVREQREQEREHAERIRERREREREHEAARQAEADRREREEAARREHAALLDGPPVNTKVDEDRARRIVAAAVAEGVSVRRAADLCGWSVGWVSARFAELRDPGTGGAELSIATG
ncbi:DUF2637 domain-containing protein [Streptomyces phaeolivaceus]|uniref:DUF2637 domain-containing protein n=1 Tax=Streptomyces phaeolivaceus TaxID=2653200 RepID=A0A5P8KB25_9ACTN|nr:DUF2637 domain-containing protein [Streptomyces phaeolivaceus]QFQ99749.1 DUF2637 domain-containing protein [Streptomyces phaeolivaceus]